jgi:hypothetical protein
MVWTVIVAVLTLVPAPERSGASQAPDHASGAAAPALTDAQRLFYNGSYEEAAALAMSLRSSAADDLVLAGYELRTSALHFQIKRALGEPADKDKAFKQCQACARLMSAFQSDIAEGQARARARLKADPRDDFALFFLGKIDLNDVWLKLGTLGKKSGWGEYWEARHSLDDVLKRNPGHVRARVARAWIDYIVDTRVPWAFRWILGGGNKTRALATIREASEADSDFFAQTEARFALWDIQVRERNFVAALGPARLLARDFPANRELARFLESHGLGPI